MPSVGIQLAIVSVPWKPVWWTSKRAIRMIARMKSTTAQTSAQGFAQLDGRKSKSSPATRGKKMMMESKGICCIAFLLALLASGPDDIVQQDENRTEQEDQGIAAHVARLHRAQAAAGFAYQPGQAATAAVQRAALDEAACQFARAHNRLDDHPIIEFINPVFMQQRLIDEVAHRLEA